MNPKALEEELNALEEVDEHIVARPDILRSLQKESTITNTDFRKTVVC
jgi:hypothetical protein